MRSQYFLQYTQNSSYTTLCSSTSHSNTLHRGDRSAKYSQSESAPVEKAYEEIDSKVEDKVGPDLL